MASMLAKCSLQAPCYIAERLSSGQAASCSPVTAMSQFTVRRPHHQRQAAAASAHAQTLQQAVRRRCAQPLRLPARARQVTAMQPYPDVPETEKERSPLDYPQVQRDLPFSPDTEYSWTSRSMVGPKSVRCSGHRQLFRHTIERPSW